MAMRRFAVALVAASLLAGCGGGDRPRGAAEAEQVHFRSADQGSATLVDRAGVVVRADCPTYGTDTGPYLSLTARTRSDDASARVAFDSPDRDSAQFGHHRFTQADFDRSYGRWDLLGTVPGRVHGRFIYRSAGGERVTLDFAGSGGRADGRCRLDGSVSSASDADPLRFVSAPPDGRWIPSPVGLAPGTGELAQCTPGPLGGGFDVWIKDISCPETRKWLRRLIATYGAFPVAKDEGVGRVEGGWECWSRLEERTGIHNVCVRGSQLIMFYAA
jgi:hypothetical protein